MEPLDEGAVDVDVDVDVDVAVVPPYVTVSLGRLATVASPGVAYARYERLVGGVHVDEHHACVARRAELSGNRLFDERRDVERHLAARRVRHGRRGELRAQIASGRSPRLADATQLPRRFGLGPGVRHLVGSHMPRLPGVGVLHGERHRGGAHVTPGRDQILGVELQHRPSRVARVRRSPRLQQIVDVGVCVGPAAECRVHDLRFGYIDRDRGLRRRGCAERCGCQNRHDSTTD